MLIEGSAEPGHCSRPGPQNGFPRHAVVPAAPAAEPSCSATGGGVEHFRCELRTGAEVETIDLWLDGGRGRIEVSYAAMGIPARGYRLVCAHRVLSPDFGVLEVERAEARRGKSGFEPVELDGEETLLPLVVEYLRVAPSPVFVH